MINLRKISSSRTGPTNGSPAFTLTELVVVIGVIVLLAATLLPALAQSEMKSQAVVCLSHMRQLQRAALLYARDHNDNCPSNFPLSGEGNNYGVVGGPPDWVYGTMGWNGNPENPAGCSTNPFYLGVNGLTGGNPVVTLNGSMGPYVKSVGAYHCPADHYIDPTYHVLRVRSCSANMYIGSAQGMTGIYAGYKIFYKFTDFGGRLTPSQCFEFLEEYPAELNDGYFDYPAAGYSINDQPALNHYQATSFSFADGHADLHIWQDLFLKSQSNLAQSGVDTMWLAQHGTYRIQ